MGSEPDACDWNIRRRKERGWGLKLFKETMAENSLNLAKDINLQFQEADRNPNKINPTKSMLKHIVIKLHKCKDE